MFCFDAERQMCAARFLQLAFRERLRVLSVQLSEWTVLTLNISKPIALY